MFLETNNDRKWAGNYNNRNIHDLPKYQNNLKIFQNAPLYPSIWA